MDGDEPWYRRYGDLIAPAYLGGDESAGGGSTADEVAFITRELLGHPGGPRRVLDVGCGTGRHARLLAAQGHDVTGVDCSPGLLEVARTLAAAQPGEVVGRLHWVEADARRLDLPGGRDGTFDVALSLHGGAFGLGQSEADDEAVLRAIARALRPGGRLLLTATAAAGLIAGFVEHAVMTGAEEAAPPFDPAWFVTHSLTVTDPEGQAVRLPAWWRAYTARELTLLCRLCGLRVERLYGSPTGGWEPRPPRLDDTLLLLVAGKER